MPGKEEIGAASQAIYFWADTLAGLQFVMVLLMENPLNSGLGDGKMNRKLLAIAGTLTLLSVSALPSYAEDLVFTLKNGTKSVLTNFYTSPVGVDKWEDDVFGKQVLNPGETIEITIGDGRAVCKYDMRFEFEEGSDLDTTEDTQDLCALGSYTIHE